MTDIAKRMRAFPHPEREEAADEIERLRGAIESAGRCLVMSNNGAKEALAILRAAKEATAVQPDAEQ
jgi:hypothetical protein